MRAAQEIVEVAAKLRALTEALNEHFRDLEDELAARRCAPCTVAMPSGKRLEWSGEFFYVLFVPKKWEVKGQRERLLNCSRETRVEAASALKDFAW